MADQQRPGERRVKRRIAATAATAALALSGSAGAATRSAARSPLPAKPNGDPISRFAGSDGRQAELELDASRRHEMATHRRRLATALAAELGGRDAGAIEQALEAAETEINGAYARGERPDFVAGMPAALTAATGLDEADLDAAFESMSRNAVARQRERRSG